MRSALFIRTGMAALLLGGSAFHCGWAQQTLTRDGEKIDFAQQLLNKSQYKLAASEYEEFIQQYPQSSFLSQAYLGAGDSYFFLKEYDKAVGFYQRYAKVKAPPNDSHYCRASDDRYSGKNRPQPNQ